MIGAEGMVGLVFADTLHLTPLQWGALAVNGASWLWYASWDRKRDHKARNALFLLAAFLLQYQLLRCFWHERLSVDQWLLFWQAHELSSLDWPAFAEEIVRRPYVRYQTPFLSFWFSRLPAMWVHQAIWFPFGLLCAGLMRALYGRAAALLLATPVVALLIHQPSHDTLLFGTLLIVLRLIQLKQRALAAFVYGLSWMVKPLTVLTAPFILPQLGWFGLGSLAMWGGYLGWSLHWTFGRLQARYLLHLLMLLPKKQVTGRPDSAFTMLRTQSARGMLKKVGYAVRWRWTHVGRGALKALPFYLFPAWLRSWSWKGVLLAGVILFGFGNIKYLLLDLLFVFPVQEERTVWGEGDRDADTQEYIPDPGSSHATTEMRNQRMVETLSESSVDSLYPVLSFE